MQSAEVNTDDPVASDDELGAIERTRRNAKFISELVMVHPKLFLIAMAGAAVFALLTVASSAAIGRVIDNVILPSFEDGGVSTSTVVGWLGLVIAIGVLRAVAIVVRRSYASITMWRVAQTFTNRVVERYVAQPVSWHNRRADGDLVQRAGVDSEATVSVLAPIPFATGTLIMLVASTIWMLVIDVPLGLVAVVVFPLLVITNVIYEKAVSKHFTRAQDQLGEFSAGVHESFEGVQLVKSYGAEERETERLAGLADRVRASRVQAIKLRSWFEALLDVIPSLTNILLVVIGALQVRSGDVTVGEFSSVIFLFTLLVFPLRLIGYTLSELPRSMAAWQRIRTVLDEPIEPDPTDRIGVARSGFGVEFAGVTFAHEGDGPPTVKDVDLAVRQGSVTALVGPTGSGKSTLAQLAAGLIGPGIRRGQAGARCSFDRVPGSVPVERYRSGQRRAGHELHRRTDLGCPRPGCSHRVRTAIAATARHRGRRARREPEWRSASTACARTGARTSTESAGTRRHHLGARSCNRGAHPRTPAHPAERLDGLDGGVAAVDHRPR